MDGGAKYRFGGSKVRTGCATCKLRHLKCDESRPACNRCIKNGQPCSGYPTPEPRQKREPFTVIQYVPQLASSTPQNLPELSLQEKRRLEYFRQRTAPEFEGSFPPKLWEEFFLLAAAGPIPVRHALLAVASMHEDYIKSGPKDLSLSDYSIAQYNRALREVSQLDISRHEHVFDTALAASVLFACVEGLCGHFQSFLSHLCSGMNVLAQATAGSPNTRLSHLSYAMLEQLFMRINIQVMAYGEGCLPLSGCTSEITSLPATFKEPHEAIYTLERFYCELMHFYESLEKALAEPYNDIEVFHTKHQAYKDHYSKWTTSANALLGGELRSSLNQLSLAQVNLHILRISVSISVHFDVSRGEMDFDRFNDDFQALVDVCEIFFQKTKPEAYPIPSFSMGIGIVPHLYVTAARCRQPATRHRALRLLLNCNRREGLWDSTLCGRVAERVISREEAAAREYNARQKGMEGYFELTTSSQVPQGARITVNWVRFETGRKINVGYLNAQPGFDADGVPLGQQEFVETLEF